MSRDIMIRQIESERKAEDEVEVTIIAAQDKKWREKLKELTEGEKPACKICAYGAGTVCANPQPCPIRKAGGL